MVDCLVIIVISCAQPSSLRQRSIIFINLDELLPSIALVASSKGRLVLGLSVTCIGISLAISSKGVADPSFKTTTSTGLATSLKFFVPGTRKIRDMSAVQAPSAFNPCLTHKNLRPSATGFHIALSIGSVKDQ